MRIFNDEFRAIIKKSDEYTITFNDNIYFIFHIVVIIFYALFEVIFYTEMEGEQERAILLVYACLKLQIKRRKRTT